jgi:translation elongation factor Ts
VADVSIEDIRKLREMTGVGMTDAKQALLDAGGDFDKALDAMRKQGLTKVAKRAEREARAGLIGSYVHDGRIGVLVEINCETDFVAKTDEFKQLVKDVCLHLAASGDDQAELMEQPFVRDPGINLGDYINQHAAKLGENIVVRRHTRYILGEAE